MKILAALVLALLISACTSFKVAPVDPKTGYFPTNSKATPVVSKPIDLDARKSLLLIPKGEFVKGQIDNMHYFDETMSIDDLERRIVQANLSDKVPSVQDRIGINNAAKHYKDFLWLHFERKGEGRIKTGRFILSDPVTMEDLFVTETTFDYAFAGVNDQNNWYPMFNSLIDYIQQNSKTYRR